MTTPASRPQQTALVPLIPTATFPAYIRPLTESECGREEVLRMIRKADEVPEVVFGIFDFEGDLYAAAGSRTGAFQYALDHKFTPQLWLC
jgi:hypothetical protein